MDRNIERFATAILAAMDEGVLIQDENGRIEACNQSAERILGISGEKLTGMTLMDSGWQAIQEDGSPVVSEMNPVAVTLRTGQPVTGFFMGMHCPDSRLAWISTNTRPILRDGRSEHVVTTLSDRTAAHSLHLAEERCRLAVEGSRDGIWDWNAESNEVFLSRRWKEILGFDEHEIGNSRAEWEDRIHPEDKPSTIAILNQHLAGETPFYEAQYRLKCKDGGWKWVLGRGTVVSRGTDGRPLRFTGVQTDITEHKKAEKARQEAEQRYRAFLANSSEGIWRYEGDAAMSTALPEDEQIERFFENARLAECNDALARMYGYERAGEMIGLRLSDLAADDPRNVDHLRTFIRSGYRVADVETVGRDRHGNLHHFVNSYSGVLENGCLVRVWGVQRDITDRKRAEEALRQSEARFALAFRSSPAALTLADIEDGVRYMDVSDSFEQISGYRRDEVVGRTREEVGFWADPVEVAEARKRLKADGKLRDFEYHFRRKDGQIRVGIISADWIEIHGRKCSLTSNMDITDRRGAVQALKESEALYRLLAENVSDVIWILDLEIFRFRYMSPSVERLLGYTAEEILALDPLETVTAKSAQFLRQILSGRIEAFQQGARQTYIDEIEQPCRNGSTVTVEVTSHYVINEQNGHLEVYGVSRDVSDRKRAEQELEISEQKRRESTERYLVVAKCIPDAIWSMDLSGRYTYVSPAVERIHGWTVEEFLKLNRTDVVTPDQAAKTDAFLRQELERAASPEYDRNKIIRLESEQRRKDGTTFWVEINAGFIWSPDGRPIGVTGVARDITDRKRAEAEREKLRAQLAQAQKMESIGRLAGGVAHDFNNQLTVINGYCGLALAKLEPEDPLWNYLDEIRKAGDHAAGLTRQLLAFSRKQLLQPRVLDLNQVVEGVRSMVARLVGENIEVGIKLDGSSVMVHADPHQLEQVIVNLVVNARDAMPNGGRLFIETRGVDLDDSVLKSHPAALPGRYTMLGVSDTGVGMDEATRERIFEPFFTTKSVGEGTGLGLSMVQGIVAQSGGYIDVHSEPGNGTTFNIYLPALTEAKAEGRTPESVQNLRGGERILVVEDQPEVREYATAVLTEYGYSVIPAADAEEALNLCKREQQRIHLVLTDVVMPHMSGRELVARLVQMRPGIKALFMSGYTQNVIADHGMRQGDVPLIQKPFGPEELAGKIRSILGPAGHPDFGQVA